MLTATIDQSEGISGADIPEQAVKKMRTGSAALSLPSPRVFFAFLITERLSTTISEPGTGYPGFWEFPLSADADKNREKAGAGSWFCKQRCKRWRAIWSGAEHIRHAHRVFHREIHRDFYKQPNKAHNKKRAKGVAWRTKHEILAAAAEFCAMVRHHWLWRFTEHFAW